MSAKDKLIDRFKKLLRDFTFDEVITLLCSLGFELDNKGKTSGSRVEFHKDGLIPIKLHKPHPGNIVKMYAMKQLFEYLTTNGLIEDKQ